ncbi:MAG: AraC family transcriptional regulator [Saprospiraceae bacterium]
MKKGDKGYSSALYVWNGLSVFWGTSFNTSPHSHDTLQLAFDIDRKFRLKDQNTPWQEHSAAIIRAGHVHQLDSNGSIQLFLYLDRDSTYAKQLTEKYLSDSNISNLEGSDIRTLSNDFFKRLLVITNCDELFHGCYTILKHLIELGKPAKRDERVDKAIAFIIRSQNKPFKVKDVADHVYLSESRLRHLFKEQVGQPIQNFILWMRVVDSLNLVLKGKRLDQTAYASGFWDPSHMNRSYKELLGVAPGAIKKYEDDIRIIACDSKSLYTFSTEIFDDWDVDRPNRIIET